MSGVFDFVIFEFLRGKSQYLNAGAIEFKNWHLKHNIAAPRPNPQTPNRTQTLPARSCLL